MAQDLVLSRGRTGHIAVAGTGSTGACID